MERWKDVNGYDGDYQISNYGRLKSLKYSKVKIKKGHIDKYGYMNVPLYKKNTKTKNYRIHLLVWEHYGIEERDGMKIVVDHKDEQKLNNHIDNLQVITQRENVSKSYKTKTSSSKYIGVCWDKPMNKWRSGIMINKKIKHLGYFDDEYEAHLTYKKELQLI